jgi:hypothetical protein
MAYIVLLVAIAISGVAAWYSIAGLMAIFSSAALSIAIMGGVLEVGKLVTASWLYQNWKTVPVLLKSYLTIAVITLMLITSMGIFGYLSKAHIDQTLSGSDNSLQITELNAQIDTENRRIEDDKTVISQLDAAVQTLIKYDRIRGRDGAIAVRESQSVERGTLTGIISEAGSKIKQIREQRQVLEKEQLKFEAEVGPIRYVAEFVYGQKADQELLEKAVRWVIIAIIFVFDPLAILLLIAANMSLLRPKPIVSGVNVSEDNWDNEGFEIEALKKERNINPRAAAVMDTIADEITRNMKSGKI